MNHFYGFSYRSRIVLFTLLVSLFGGGFAAQLQAQALVAYAGGTGKERFYDVLELSNGKVLVAGTAADLAWVGAAPVTTLSVNFSPGITSYLSSDTRVAFLMLLSSNQTTIEGIWRMPSGTVTDVSRIRTTTQPGTATGDIIISGRRNYTANTRKDGYYLAKLSNNFVAGNPTATNWYYPVDCKPRGASPSSYKEIQPWDVGGDGNVLFGMGTDYDFDWAAIQKLSGATGTRMLVNDWPAHWGNGGWSAPGPSQTVREIEWDGTPATAAPATMMVRKKSTPTTSPLDSTITFTLSYSAVVLKTGRAGTLRSTTLADWLFDGLDENRNARKGKFPDDWYHNGPLNGPPSNPGTARGRLTAGTSYGPEGSGYYVPRPTLRLGAITVDRRDNHFYYGTSTQSVLPGGQPDFEPTLVAMNGTGKMKWWARIYNQRAVSEPDQYVDGLEIDYAADNLAVLARQHGAGSNVFFKGNQLYYNTTGVGFQNSLTGVNTIQTGHYAWIGKYDLLRTGVYPQFPKLKYATYMGEYSDNPSGLGSPSTDPQLDRWPTPNTGFPDLNTTRGITRLAVTKNGAICVAASGRRTITTRDAYQKMRKPGTGSVSSWNNFIRVYRPDLSSIVYSSILTGAWDTLTGSGGSNVDITGFWPFANGIFVTGYHTADVLSGVANGNSMPTANVPTWGKATPQSEDGVFGRLAFVNQSPINMVASRNTFCTTAPNNTYSLAFTPPPAFLTTFGGGNQFIAEISDATGKFVEQGGSSTTIGTLSSSSNATQNIPVTLTGFLPGSGYGVRVRATSPTTGGYWYPTTIVNAQPGTPGSISGLTTVCANSAGSSVYSINKVAGASSYEWRLIPTENPSPPPACNNDPGCAGIVAASDTSAIIIWNPNYSGSATLEVRAVNPCGQSSWMPLSIPSIAPCITTTFSGTYCEDQTAVKVPFAVPGNISLAGGNVFTAQLSDALGDFSSPTNIGTKSLAVGPGPRFDTVTVALPIGLSASTAYKIRVIGSGISPTAQGDPSQALGIRVKPTQPSTPTGTASLCFGSVTGVTQTYSVAAFAGASYYEWQILPDTAGTILQVNDNQVTIQWNDKVQSPQVRVRIQNECGLGPWSSYLMVVIQNCIEVTAVSPGTTLCPGQTGVTVSLSTPNGLAFNSGNTFSAQVIDGNGSLVGTLGSFTGFNTTPFNSITGTTGASVFPSLTNGTYYVRFRSSNPVRTGAGFPITVTGLAPAQPGSITSSTTSPSCGQAGTTHSISAVSGAVGYRWSIIPGAAGSVTTNGTTSATITWSGTYTVASATLQVKAYNSCDSSIAQTQTITLNCTAPVPPQGADANGEYRSRASGPWEFPQTWETKTAGNWVTATVPPNNTSSGVITVRNGHTVGFNYPQLGGAGMSFASPVTGVDLTGVTNSSNGTFGGSLNSAVVTADGRAYRSLTQATGGGQTWAQVTLTGTAVTRLNHVSAFTGGQRVIAVGNGGTIKRGDGGAASTVGGATWADVTVTGGAPTANLIAVDINVGNGGIVGNNGTVVVVTGGTGATFDNVTTAFGAPTTSLKSCFMTTSTGPLHVVGAGGYYRSTSSFGTSPAWNAAQTLGGGIQLNDIHFSTALDGIIVGNGGLVLRTVNGGTTWTQYNHGLTTADLLSVRSNNGNIIYIVGAGGAIIYNENFQNNFGWRLLPSITSEDLLDVFPANEAGRHNGHIVGRNGTIIAGVAMGGGTNVDQLVIAAGGTLLLGNRGFNPQNGTGNDIDIAGTLDCTPIYGGFENPTGSTHIVRAGGTYRQGRQANTSGYVIFGRKDGTPAATVTYMPTSTVEIYQDGGDSYHSTGALYSNFTWNCPGQSSNQTLSGRGFGQMITGTFKVQSTGTAALLLDGTASNRTYTFPATEVSGGTFILKDNNIAADRITLATSTLTISGGNFRPIGDQGQANLLVGNYAQTGGTLNFAAATSNNKHVLMRVTGNFLQTGGTLTQTVTSNQFTYGSTRSPIRFEGTAAQSINASGTLSGFINLQFIGAGPYNLSGNVSVGSGIPVRLTSGSINLNANTFTADTLIVTGASGPAFSTLNGSGAGAFNTKRLTLVSGIVDNSQDRLTVTDGVFTAIKGGSRTSFIGGALRKGFDASLNGSFTFPIGVGQAYKGITLQTLKNDATTKMLGATIALTGANQATGTNIVGVGAQPQVGGLNWRIRRTDGATGTLTALGGVAVTSDTFLLTHRLGQSIVGLTSGFASIGNELVKNTYSTSAARLYDMSSSKVLNLSTIASSGGSYFAIGAATAVAPPGGGWIVGPGGDFDNLTSVAAHYNDVTFTAPATFTFNSTYNGKADGGGVEEFPITFRSNQTQPVTIRYTGSSTIETSSSIATPVQEALVVLDGSDKVTFQGNDKWLFLNKGKCISCAAIRMQNDATQNTIKDMVLEGSTITTGYNGVLHFGTSTKPLGNSNNLVESSSIGSNSERRRGPNITAIANNSYPGVTPGAVINATNTSPITIFTAGPHGFATGDEIFISGVMGNQAANGKWNLTVTSATTFTIPTAGNGGFTVKDNGSLLVQSVSATNPSIVTTPTSHHFRDRMEVSISGTGTQADNGNSYQSSFIDSLSATTFALYQDPGLTIGLSTSASATGRLFSPQRNGSITLRVIGASNTSPVRITLSAKHSLVTGQAVWLKGVLGNTGANGIWLITKVDDYNFTLNNSVGNGTFAGGGYFAVPPLVVTAVAHGLLDLQQITIGGVAGIYTANGNHYVDALNANTFALFTEVGLIYPRFITTPPIASSVGVTATRPGLPITMTPNQVIANGTTVTFRVNQTIGAQMLGKTFRVNLSSFGGFGSKGSGINNNAYCATVIVTGAGTSQFTINSNATGTWTSGGTINAAMSVENFQNNYKFGAPTTSYFNPQVAIANGAPGNCMVIDDDFTIAGLTSHPNLNSTFKVVSLPYGQPNFGAWQIPTPALPAFGADPGYPYNGAISAARDSLVEKLVFSQNQGTSLNQNNTIRNNSIFSFNTAGMQVNAVGNGGGWTVSGNSFYQLPSQPPTTVDFRALDFRPGSKASGNLIENNYFGGSAPLATGTPLSYSLGGGQNLTAMYVDAGNTSATLVRGNIVKNINTALSGGSLGLVTAIHHAGGWAKITNNIIGGENAGTLADTMVQGNSFASALNFILLNSSGEAECTGNLIQRINYAGAAAGISVGGAGKVLVKNNTVRRMGNVTSGNGITGFKVSGGSSSEITIDSNHVYNITSENVTGITVAGANTAGVISRNRIYGFKNGAQQNQFGISIAAATTSPLGWRVLNNQITLSSAVRSDPETSNGVELDFATGGTLPKVYFNTIYIGGSLGTGPGAPAPMSGFAKRGTGMGDVRNNIFYVVGSFTGGTYPGYAAYVQNTTGWNGSLFTNNLLYSVGGQNSMGYWGVQGAGTLLSDLTQFQTITGSSNNVFSSANFKFDQPAIDGNLHLNAENCPIKDKGTSVAFFNDFDSLNIRDKAKPDLGANEFSRGIPSGAFWTGLVSADWNTDANWCDLRVPLDNEDVVISNAPIRPYMPVVSTPTATCRNINLIDNPGSMLVVHGPGAALTIGGKNPLVKFKHENIAHISGAIWFSSDSAMNIPAPALAETFAGRNTNLSAKRISAFTYTTAPDVVTITTAVNHGLVIGDLVEVRDVRGLANVNTLLKVRSVTSATTFTSAFPTSGAFISGMGKILPLAAIPVTNVSGFTVSPITVTTGKAHNLAVGQYVTLTGINGNLKANGSFMVATMPTATSFTIIGTGDGNYTYDSLAYVLPSRTGYSSMFFDGASTKTMDGVLQATSLTLLGGNLNLPYSENIIRDTVYVNSSTNLNVTTGTLTVGTLTNGGGTITVSGATTITDSLVTKAGTTNLLSTLTVGEGGRLLNSANTTITGNYNGGDTISNRGGTLTFGASVLGVNNIRARAGLMNVTTGGVVVNDSVILTGGNINLAVGNMTIGDRLRLRQGLITTTSNTNEIIMSDPAANAIIGGSTASYVEPGLRLSNNTTGGTTFTITGGTTNATPILVNHTNHNLQTGDVVMVSGNVAHPRANGVWLVTRITANQFALVGTIGSATSGAGAGLVQRLNTKVYPIGRSGMYRPVQVHLRQTNGNTSTYMSRLRTGVPPTLTFPTAQLAYEGGVEDITGVVPTNFYNVTATATNFAAGAITLSYGLQEAVVLHNRRYLTILKDSTPTTVWKHLYGNSVDSVSAIRTVRSTRPFFSFSDFTLGGLNNAPLPVSLLAFNGQLKGVDAVLTWQTLKERSTSHFVLERSFSGASFEAIATIVSKGDNESGGTYTHLDNDVFMSHPNAYYRLRMVDVDGSQSLSQVVRLSTGKGSNLQLVAHPNPFKTRITLISGTGLPLAGKLLLLDVLGRQVTAQQIEIGAQGFELDTESLNLPKGTYQLHLTTPEGTLRQMMVKE